MATKKVSITLDADVLAELRERVGPRGLSAYINEAVRRELKLDRMDEFLEGAEERAGPPPKEALEEAHHLIWGD
ncbi:MAG: hypothetical protein GEV03_20345 [Streptosporangiales bacterium]|nr:hypothetical protein [Streptosporangiales bacterium]